MAVADPPLPRLGFRTPACDFFQLFCDAAHLFVRRQQSVFVTDSRSCGTRDELARSFQSDPAGIGIASFDATQKVVAGQIGRGSAANPSITKNVEPARPDRHCQTVPSGTKTKLPAPASKAR